MDVYSCMEGQRLRWVRFNQKELRAHLYRGVQDAVARGDTNTASLGQRIILPSTFIGGPRHMHQLYQDAMAIVRKHGKPDLFITMTCNPGWPEIKQELLNGQTPLDRPDLVARVFKLKLDSLRHDILHNEIFGRVTAAIHVIEWQKRGLPHAHILVILAPEHKPRCADDYNSIISAELPDKEKHPATFATVSKHMLHGPCGVNFTNSISPCMQDGKCSKNYPKAFVPETVDTNDSYPRYRRREDGKTHEKSGFKFDNRWVVPHNPYLCAKYDAHINVEITSSIKAVKYLYKYVYKGHDRITMGITTQAAPGPAAGVPGAPAIANAALDEQNVDEIKSYIDARYVSASEACWRLLGFSLHGELPAVTRLAVHLPDEQQAVWVEGQALPDVAAHPQRTTLTEWFSANTVDEAARVIPYSDMPAHYVWKDKRWKRRIRRGKMPTIGRVASCSPLQGERFYLRMLLHHVLGAKSFADMRTYGGTVYPTFKEAAQARGLLSDDSEWDACLAEAMVDRTGKGLRHLFADLLIHNRPAEPHLLWEKYKQPMAEDILHRLRQVGFLIALPCFMVRVDALQGASLMEPAILQVDGDLDMPYNDAVFQEALRDVDDLLQEHGQRLSDIPNMPALNVEPLHVVPREIRLERQMYDLAAEAQHLHVNEGLLNVDQRAAFDAVDAALFAAPTEVCIPLWQLACEQVCTFPLNSFTSVVMMRNLCMRGKAFFIDGPGGTGKTFLYSLLLARVRAEGQIALPVASSGIAALLLAGGKTAHSRLKIPVNVDEYSTCRLANCSIVPGNC